MIHLRSLATSLLVAMVVVTGISGCAKKTEESKTDTQVVAKVNGDEISIHQVNFQLGRLGKISEEQSKSASRQILSRLVDQQLLTQKALEAKLDRDPNVLQILENSKREILAQSYLERQMAQASKPTAKEMDDFYAQHPELFEKRRVYRLQELAVAVGQDKAAEIEEGLKNTKGLNEIAAWLKSKNYQFSANANVRAAEQLPLNLLTRLQRLRDGEFMVIPTDRSVNIVQVVASQEQPVSREKASSIIEQYFLNKRKTEIAKQEIEKLRTAAKIDYVGAFADMKTADATKETQKQPEVQAKPAAVGKTQEHIDKGLSGL